MAEELKEQIARLPDLPGVYIYRDGEGKALYVGEAKRLRRRIRQYFSGSQAPRTAIMVGHIDSIETIITGTEKEALLLESNLIKRFRPPYNVDLKDDKSYPYFRITVQDPYPRVEITRKVVRDKSLYFGPFTDAGSARATLKYLHRAFPFRRCAGSRPGGRGRPGRPCLDFQMGRCMGPCEERISEEDYRKIIDDLIGFLKGKGRRIVRSLEKDMDSLSSSLKFEEAAVIRDRIKAINTVLEKQDVVGDPDDDVDVIGYESSAEASVLVNIHIRSGLIVGRNEMVMPGGFGTEEALNAYILAYYRNGVYIPGKILFPIGLEFGAAYEDVLGEAAGKTVMIRHPVRGKGARLLSLARENAAQSLIAAREEIRRAGDVMADLAKALGMPSPPSRIECIDISHTAGKQTYGSIVAWEEGELVKADYRLFAIRGDQAPGDDYAALEEVVERRFRGSLSRSLLIPDLLLVDGGVGQLARVVHVLDGLSVELPATASIAKARAAKRRKGPGVTDEIFIPERSNPVRFPAGSRALHLLQMLRDEAHRFALTGHRKKRGKTDLISALDGIEGIGPARRTALMKRFRSLREIGAAPVEEIASLSGFNRRIAERVKEALEPDPPADNRTDEPDSDTATVLNGG